jgi:hypothetical protein
MFDREMGLSWPVSMALLVGSASYAVAQDCDAATFGAVGKFLSYGVLV